MEVLLSFMNFEVAIGQTVRTPLSRVLKPLMDSSAGIEAEYHHKNNRADVMCFSRNSTKMVNLLKKVVGKVVSKAQGAFVEGRQILDAMLIANEAIDSIIKNNESGILCKLDIEKAYDKVDWTFILTIMQKMGFGEKWIRWIKWCISTASSSVLVNGTPTGFFQSSRGRVKYMDDLAWEFGCSMGSLPTTYLGMPLGAPFKSLQFGMTIFIQGRKGNSYSKHVIEFTHLSNVIVVLTKLSQMEIRENPKGLPLGGGWCSREAREAHGMGLWKGIRMDWKLVSDRMVFKVGNGRKVRFWRIDGVGFSFVYVISFSFALSFNDWEVEEAERFLERLQGKRVIEDVEDMVSWIETKSGKFSVKSLYVALEAGGSSLFPSSYIWNVNVQPKRNPSKLEWFFLGQKTQEGVESCSSSHFLDGLEGEE
ncbi:hypothetical protein AAG906_033381 [Vitis piasezkii]